LELQKRISLGVSLFSSPGDAWSYDHVS